MASFPRIQLKKGKEKSLHRRHPWVFSGAIHRQPEGIEEGQVVAVVDSGGNLLGLGHYQIGSITVRIISFEQVPINHDFWKKRLKDAIEFRHRLGLVNGKATNMCRLVHGEGDGLPGLIVDWYAGTVVIQCHSVGFFLIRDVIVDILQDILGSELVSIYDKSEQSIPFKAPVDPHDGLLYGSRVQVEGLEHGHIFRVNVKDGQKTGFFLDQRENRRQLSAYAKDKRILNTFSYSGGFSVYGLSAGAQLVHSVDSSQTAVDLANENAALNAGTDRHQGITADVFKYLQEIDDQYDLIVLDPPAFAKHRKVLDQALRGYRTINHKAIQRIRPNGILFTFSCSQAVSMQDFRRTVFSAAAMAGRDVSILHQLYQPADHPVSIYHPEGEYLKGLVLWVK